jgi:hypothetical protein
MSEKRFIEPHKDCRVIKNIQTGETAIYYDTEDGLMFLKWLNNLSDENEQLKKDVEYWKQVASQYSNELNVFEHCKKYKTECKDIYWGSD